MDGMISQEMVHGEEYTVDVFFSKDFKPIYIVPRKRIDVKDGKSTKGMVVNNPKIDKLITKISNNIKFLGPINFQLFETKKGGLFLIEVNPRIAGGMALGFAASENWINLIVENILNEKTISVKNIDYGLKMTRYYSECFFK
jgi:carbamoyl-phosphate synthase large subunit